MTHLRVLFSFLAVIVASVHAREARAGLINATNYSLTQITGSYAWGQTDWNDVAGQGFVNNGTDLAKVQTLMSDGYANSPPGGTVNGVYNWLPGGFHALEFQFNGGQQYTLDQLTFISSRSYGPGTPISVDYSLGGGPWITAVATTSGALGISTGSANTYVLNLGGVVADAFRFTTNGGDQVSLHEISIFGSPAAVPEPASLAIFGFLTVSVIGYVGLRGPKKRICPIA
ncbi:MAG TPA: hypothetical protein VFE62_15310 [Gemmataceae bacterium]|nr:hypothetical protein [Gemmataceae bacterium]